MSDAGWQRRRITLVGDEAGVDVVCLSWEEHGWVICSVDPAPPTALGLECHQVTVAVPPTGWLDPGPSTALSAMTPST